MAINGNKALQYINWQPHTTITGAFASISFTLDLPPRQISTRYAIN